MQVEWVPIWAGAPTARENLYWLKYTFTSQVMVMGIYFWLQHPGASQGGPSG